MVKFHCWVLGTTKCRGTARTNRADVGMEPLLPGAQPNCPACVVSFPGNPRKAAWQRTKLGLSVPAAGSALGFEVAPAGQQEGGAFGEKNSFRQPGFNAPEAMGRYGAWKES